MFTNMFNSVQLVGHSDSNEANKKLIMFTFIFFIASTVTVSGYSTFNDRPIIGILAQKFDGDYKNYGSQNYSYIAASYIKFIESSGGRPVPIHINMSQEYYQNVFNSINGILFPGGDADLNNSGYAKAGRILYDLAIKANLKGDYFPILGVCLGFEFLTVLEAGGNYLQNLTLENVATSINFEKSYEKTRQYKMFAALNLDLYQAMATEKVAIHFHEFGISKETFIKTKLNTFYQIIAQNVDANGIKFVSIIEADKFPFYGVAFHPEKNMFEFILNKNRNQIPHSYRAIQSSQHFANFFVNETRKNFHRFHNVSHELNSLIYNYQSTFMGAFSKYASFEELYFFNNDEIHG